MKTLLVIALIASGSFAHATGLRETVTNLCRTVFFVDYFESLRLARDRHERFEQQRRQDDYSKRIEHYTKEIYRVVVDRAPNPQPILRLRENLYHLTAISNHWLEDVLRRESRILATAIVDGNYGKKTFEELVSWGDDLNRQIQHYGNGKPNSTPLSVLEAQLSIIRSWIEAANPSAIITKMGRGSLVNDPFIIRYNGKLVDVANTPFEQLPPDVRSIFEMAASSYEAGNSALQINYIFNAAFQQFLLRDEAFSAIRPY